MEKEQYSTTLLYYACAYCYISEGHIYNKWIQIEFWLNPCFLDSHVLCVNTATLQQAGKLFANLRTYNSIGISQGCQPDFERCSCINLRVTAKYTE